MMKTIFLHYENIKTVIHSFHEDESGVTALESVMIVAVAAMVVAVIIGFARQIMSWCDKALKPEL